MIHYLFSPSIVKLLEKKRENNEAITFDEVTLEDKPTDFHPLDVRFVLFRISSNCYRALSFVTRKIALKGCGILSAAMDTVTEKELALAIAKSGGMGIFLKSRELIIRHFASKYGSYYSM